MSVLRFKIPATLDNGAAAALERLRFVAGYDRTPFPTTVSRQDDALDVAHDLAESGYISVPWPIAGFGFPVTISATLRERSEPYRLLTELARGKLNQIRNMSEDWKQSGLEIPDVIVRKVQEATQSFVHSVVESDADADLEALRALESAYAIAAELTCNYLEASSRPQRSNLGRPAARCSCRIQRLPSTDDAELYLNAFEVVHYSPIWSEIEPQPAKYDWSVADAVIEWAAGQGKPVIIGPLIDLGSEHLPKWLQVEEGDVTTLAAYFCDYIETAVNRYRDKVRDWVLCTAFNHADLHSISQDDRLRLVVRMLESARGIDPDGRWVIGVSQPWGEYLDRPEMTLSPLVFCDTLLRTGLSIAGFSLELFAGDHPRASLLREPLELLRLLELYGLLSVPLDIVASHPGRSGNSIANAAFSTCHKADDSTDSQAEWGGTIAALANTLSHIRCFSWNEWADGAAAQGLIAADGQPKPLLFRLRHFRSGFPV